MGRFTSESGHEEEQRKSGKGQRRDSGDGEWSHEVVEEFAVPNTTQHWKTQISTAPDGNMTAGIRKFARKKDGTLQVTNSGLAVSCDEICPRLLRKLAKMLNNLADNVEARGQFPRSPNLAATPS